jgi:hypothetical protein
MKSHPILFSSPMVRALIEGRKTQTRRIVKPQPLTPFNDAALRLLPRQCPYGQPGDLLWVRETWFHPNKSNPSKYNLSYRADADAIHNWYPSIHMPRWVSRLTLELTDVRVERLQAIGEEDAAAEGVVFEEGPVVPYPAWCREPKSGHLFDSAKDCFESLWGIINGPESWDENPWVWALTFKVHHQNVNDFLRRGGQHDRSRNHPENDRNR